MLDPLALVRQYAMSETLSAPDAVRLAAREHVGAVAAGKALADVSDKTCPRDAREHLAECLERAPTMTEVFALVRCIRAAARREAERWIERGADEDDELADALYEDEQTWRSDTAVAVSNADACLRAVELAERRRKMEAA